MPCCPLGCSPAARGQGSGLSHPHQLQGQIACRDGVIWALAVGGILGCAWHDEQLVGDPCMLSGMVPQLQLQGSLAPLLVTAAVSAAARR
jgi:hypothetical protein